MNENENFKPLLLYNIITILQYKKDGASGREIYKMIKSQNITKYQEKNLKNRIYRTLKNLHKAGKLERNWQTTKEQNATITEFIYKIKN